MDLLDAASVIGAASFLSKTATKGTGAFVAARFVLICNTLAAKSGPGVTDLGFDSGVFCSSRFVTDRALFAE